MGVGSNPDRASRGTASKGQKSKIERAKANKDELDIKKKNSSFLRTRIPRKPGIGCQQPPDRPYAELP